MKTRSILVSFPGYPFTLRTLYPCPILAGTAGALEESGHETRVWDFGTVETLDRLFPERLRSAARLVVNRFLEESGGAWSMMSAMWRLRGMERTLRVQQWALGREVAKNIAADKGVDFVAIAVNREEDLHYAVSLARYVREHAPQVRLVAIGRFIETYGEALGRIPVTFDVLCVGEPGRTLAEWADRLDTPETWCSIPNLVMNAGSEAFCTGRREEPEVGGAFPALYDSDMYPALEVQTKFRLFLLEDERGEPEDAAQARCMMPRMKPVKTLCDEVARLGREYGARAFHFPSAHSPAAHAHAVAYELLRRGLSIRYSRWGAISGANTAAFASLKASGCQALSFLVPTGSQWLLSDYYGRDFGVSQTENVLRACRFSNIFTVLRCMYPCPADDYHTRAETVRLVRRARPHAVEVERPPVAMDTTETQRYLEHLLAGRTGYFYTEQLARPLPYRPKSRSGTQAAREHHDLVREIAELGVTAALSADTALVARVYGYEGHEHDFNALVRRLFFTGDAEGLAAMADRFNACVAGKSKLAARETAGLDLAAVGN